MHELGVLLQVVKQVEGVARQNKVSHIEKVVLQVGELSSMIPAYMYKLYPMATEGSILAGSELHIDILPANALCKDCRKVFGIVEHQGICPYCASPSHEIISGREFMIKEILVL